MPRPFKAKKAASPFSTASVDGSALERDYVTSFLSSTLGYGNSTDNEVAVYSESSDDDSFYTAHETLPEASDDAENQPSGLGLACDSGGGAPLYSPKAYDSTPKKEANGATKSDSPTDDEMALVRASTQFNQISQENMPSYPNGPKGYTNNNHPIGQQTHRPMTAVPPPARPGTAFQHQNYYGGPPRQNQYRPDRGFPPQLGPPTSMSNNPLYNGFGDIQARLITAQQYVRISPGFSSESAGNIQSLLVSVGQDLTHFTTNIVQEHTKSQHQAGELRVQLEKAQKELLARRQQIAELQEQYQRQDKERDRQAQEIAALKKQLESDSQEIKRLRRIIKHPDDKYVKQIRALKNEIEALRISGSNPMQLVRNPDTPTPGRVSFKNSLGSDDDVDTTTSALKARNAARRDSSLNPQAPSFGPRAEKPDHSKELLPMLMKYSSNNNVPADRSAQPLKGFAPEGPMTSLASKPNHTRILEPQDARAYDGNYGHSRRERCVDTFSGHRREFSSASGYSSGLNEAFGTASRPNDMRLTNYKAPMPAGTPRQFNTNDAVDLNEFTEGESHLARDKELWQDTDIVSAFQYIYGLIEGVVATQHCESPFNDADNMLSISHPTTWDYILSMGLSNRVQSASHMSTLLARKDCRHFVIKRVMIDYVFNRMVAPKVFEGYSDEMDGHLRALQERMRSRIPGQNAGRPQGQQRQRIIEDHAKLISFIVTAEEASDFRANLIEDHTTMLRDILKPMRSCVVDDEKAFKAISIVIKAAWTITSKIWTSGMTLHFFFPETGSKFSFGTMRPMNFMNVQPEQMQYSQFRVMLIVTPTLSLRDDRDLDSLRTHELMKADVLVMK